MDKTQKSRLGFLKPGEDFYRIEINVTEKTN